MRALRNLPKYATLFLVTKAIFPGFVRKLSLKGTDHDKSHWNRPEISDAGATCDTFLDNRARTCEGTCKGKSLFCASANMGDQQVHAATRRSKDCSRTGIRDFYTRPSSCC